MLCLGFFSSLWNQPSSICENMSELQICLHRIQTGDQLYKPKNDPLTLLITSNHFSLTFKENMIRLWKGVKKT